MKKLSQIILIVILGSILIKAQESTIAGELSFDIINNNGSLVEIEYELISPLCWHAPVHNITELFNGGTQTTNQNETLEFLACWETTPSQYYRTFGLGYYKFTARVNGITKDYFYIDYRTSTLPENFNPQGDIRLDFNVLTGILYYYNTQTEFPAFTTIWEEKPHVGVSTSDLPDFWHNSLVVINNGNGNPKSVWGPHPDDGSEFDVELYNIYRAVPPGFLFTLIASVDDATFEYTDFEYGLGGPIILQYKVTALYENIARSMQETDPTNTVIVNGTPAKRGYQRKYFDNFLLYQNYPNPFNPATIISFSVAENSFITLKVYDVLGNEITTLVSEEKAAGLYTVNFNASNLPSGIYFYEI